MEKSDGLRRPLRRAARLPVDYRSGGVSGTAETTEVSLRGVFVKTEEPLCERKLVHLSLALPGGKAVDLHGMVEEAITVEKAKTDDVVPGMAIRFYGLGIRAQGLWEAFVHSSREALTPPPEPVVAEEEDSPDTDSVVVDEGYIDDVEKAKAIAEEPTKLLNKRTASAAVEPSEVYGHAPAGDQAHAVLFVKLPTIESLDSFRTSAIDSGGMHISVPRSLAEGRQVVVRVVHPKSGHEFHIPGEVITTSPPRPGISVKFLEATDLTREAYERFVTGALGRSQPSELSLDEAPSTIPRRASDWSIENTFELSIDDLSPVLEE